MTAFVFKIQANMDPNHRDRIAFARLCSGKLERGMKAKHVRTGKPISLHAPQFFFAQDRAIADEAFAGDVVGIPNHGNVAHRRHADRRRDARLRRRAELRAGDPPPRAARRRDEGEEAQGGAAADGRGRRRAGVSPDDGSPAIVGVVGALQLDVLKERLSTEYGLPVEFDQSEFQLARWISCADRKAYDTFIEAHRADIAEDLDGDPVYLARSQFYLDYTRERAPGIVFTDIKDVKAKAA